MQNIFDYIFWRGDLTLKQSPFGEIDAFVLSCLAYCFFHKALKPYDTTSISIEDVAKRVEYASKVSKKNNRMRDKRDTELLLLLGKSKRFKNMKLCCYVDHIHRKKEAQFSAITIMTQKNHFFVSYRGTDRSLVGWKEDMNMTYRDFVPAQVAAACYLVYVSQRLNGKISIGGHSKGGNLAVFAGAVAPKKIQNRIIRISNYDGPGFHSKILKFKGYKEIVPKVKTFMPETSIIGMMLARGEKYKVVVSYEKGLLQHDPYSWKIYCSDFDYVENISKGSKFFDSTLKNWLKVLPKNKREDFFNAFYEMLEATHSNSQGEVVVSAKNLFLLLKTFPYEDEQTRKIILEGFRLYFVVFLKAILETF